MWTYVHFFIEFILEKMRGGIVQLSTRLAAIASFVPRGSHVIDVGTDHAYIPIYLVEEGLAVSCLATDINKGPLEKAQKNLAAHGICHVELMQTNGVEGIAPDKGDVLMISGMGGYLIVDILKRGQALIKNIKRMILQPQQDIVEVRKYLHTIGFEIVDETFVKDEDKYYTVIVAEPGKVKTYDKEYEYLYGKCLIEKKLPVFKEWIEMKLAKQEGIYNALQSQDTPSAMARKGELEKEIQVLREVATCLN